MASKHRQTCFLGIVKGPSKNDLELDLVGIWTKACPDPNKPLSSISPAAAIHKPIAS